MSIDWITVTAQLANFLVLVWLLKRFLYRPILDGIDAREAEIAERMQIAARTEEDAKATEADYRAQLAALQSEQATMSEAARQRAEKERDTLLAEANNRIERERTAWMAHLDEEARSFKGKMQRTAVRRVEGGGGGRRRLHRPCSSSCNRSSRTSRCQLANMRCG